MLTMMLPVFLIFCFVYVVNGLQNPYCSLSCEYGPRTMLHTVCERGGSKCGPALKCGPDFKVIELDDLNRKYILDMHNELRNKVASGFEKRNLQPSATNMKLLNYDKELEFIAQCWANTCNGNPLNHDLCRRTKKHAHVGQNLAFFNSSSPTVHLRKIIKKLVMYWYDEVAIYKNNWVQDTQDRGPHYKVGHYTQMMWSDTDSIGCAMSYYTTRRGLDEKWHNYVLVCNYSPGGNYISIPVYDIGKPCSKCGDAGCNEKYKALCGKSKNFYSYGDFSPFFVF